MSEMFMSWTGWAWALGLIGLGIAAFLYRYVRGQDSGNEMMVDLSDQIHSGAMAFLRREYTFLAVFVAVVAALLGWAIGIETTIAYVAGAFSSGLAGFFGMKAATR
ncbi:MAG: sodium-translocating pyrophosphatase, partial [Gemmatimonadetes bacterium]|nr:sodium-translocating pyrophosphatase [Gemmatimonadota bacterium]NIR81034.1 sodium-translocating pyrophosphatase [Gemmatimonadota bacterium]NIT89852.1 sodium-translocating pyrophosphatase [Gemmatimonadota bacterium]NIU33651.1 sodium-translocating pyrophosphatase [Gemmatimonadota bacterium]NIU37894.1 sodium-translocating pyrophosphatase [Gemmatimonadota bacterium]